MNKSTLAARRGTLTTALMLSVLGLAAGCAGHGNYTTNFKNEATERMALVKAGTQWDTAQQQFLSGDLDKALKTIDSSIAITATVPKCHLLRGRILLELGRTEPAMEAFDEAIKLDPKHTEAFYYRGVVMERLNKPEEALSNYRQAGALDRSNPQYALAAAEMLVQLGRLAEARELLDPPAGSDLPRFDQTAGVRQTLGHIALMEHDLPRALVLFKEACTLSPDQPSLIEDLARAQIEAGQYADAESGLSFVLSKVKPEERRDLRLLKARCLVEIQRPVDARSLLLELVSDPKGAADVEAWLQLGNIAVIVSDDIRLKEAGNRVIALAPQRHEGYMLLGLYQRRMAHLQTAADLLGKSVERSTDDPTPAILLGLVYEQLGQADKARESYGKALAINPGNDRANRLLQTVGDRSKNALATVKTDE